VNRIYNGVDMNLGVLFQMWFYQFRT